MGIPSRKAARRPARVSRGKRDLDDLSSIEYKAFRGSEPKRLSMLCTQPKGFCRNEK
jgi:hypothetical protein